MKKNKFIMLILAGLLFNSVLDSKGVAATNKEIIGGIAKNVILKTYEDMAAQTENLRQRIIDFSRTPTRASLDKAQNAWRAARTPWESSEGFLFGPVYSAKLDPQFDTWPLSRLELDGVLSGTDPITEGSVDLLANNLKGYHTIEYLLFGDGLKLNDKELGKFDQRQYDYLKATSTILHRDADKLAKMWSEHYNPEKSSTPGYVEVISNPSLENPFYASEKIVLTEYLDGMLGILTEVGKTKMSNPLGADKDKAQVDQVESPFAWNSLADFMNNVQSAHNVYTGAYGDNKGPGMRDFVKSKNVTLALGTEIEILKSKRMIQRVSGPDGKMPFRQAILDPGGRDRIGQAIKQLEITRIMMEMWGGALLDWKPKS